MISYLCMGVGVEWEVWVGGVGGRGGRQEGGHTHTQVVLASLPGLHAQLLSLAVRKAGRRPGQIYHVMCAAADITFSLLTSGFVLSPSLFFPWTQFVLSLQFVPQVRLLLDWSWLATVRDVSSGTHHVINPSRPSPAFHTTSDKSWAWRPGNEARLSLTLLSLLHTWPWFKGQVCGQVSRMGYCLGMGLIRCIRTR